jgi:hypothetical protein
MSALRVGIVLDESGRPTRSVSLDEGPSRARTSAHSATTTPSYRGTLVQGASGDGRTQAVERQAKRRRGSAA